MGVRSVWLCDACGRETTMSLNDSIGAVTLKRGLRCLCGNDLMAQEQAKLVDVVLERRADRKVADEGAS